MKGDSLLRQSVGNELHRRYSLWRLILANLIDLVRLLHDTWPPLIGFLFIVVSTATYLHFVHTPHLAPLEALYESLRQIIFQSPLNLPKDPLGEVIFFAAPIIGVLLVLQSVVTFGRGYLDKHSRMQAWQVSLALTYRDHVIVCGLGRLGLRVITRLLEVGHEPVVIESNWNSPMVRHALRMKVPVIVGDARDPQTLRQARITAARAVIASIDGDMVDIEIALVAQDLNPKARMVLRAFSDELDADLEQAFGPGSAFSTSGLAATTFAAAIVSHGLEYVIPLGPGNQILGVAELYLGEGSPLAGPVAAIENAYPVRALAVKRPRGQAGRRQPVAHVGDTLTLIGSLAGLEAARAANGSLDIPITPLPVESPPTVIICGLGKVGYRVVRRLSELEPRPRLVVIDKHNDHEQFVKRVREMDGVTFIQGDATDVDCLKEAGIERAAAIAALTAHDDVNLRIGLATRSAHPDIHVVLRVYSYTLAQELIHLFGIHTAYSTSNLASPTLAIAGLLPGVRRAFLSNGAPFISFDWSIATDDSFNGKTGEQIRAQTGALVVARWRDSALTLLPSLDEPLVTGDKITVVGAAHDIVQAKLLETS